MKKKLVVALAGNPNSGKTTIFNELTGARQHVGNYPGVTVERKEGSRRHRDVDMQIIDLPGIYSLTAYSAEELIARNFIIDEKPDVVVDILDSSTLERNLYLAVQLLELGVPLVLAFNMSDMARARGFKFDIEKLSRLLGVRIVETVGHRGEGIPALLDAVIAASAESGSQELAHRQVKAFRYKPEIEVEISKLEAGIHSNKAVADEYNVRWLAIKLLERDKELLERLKVLNVNDLLESCAKRIEQSLDQRPETAVASSRYDFISEVCEQGVRSTIAQRKTLSDRIDSVVTNRILGLPVFLLMMFLVFQLTFTLGGPPMGWIEGFFGWLGGVVEGWWPEGSESLLKSLLVDGIIGGVGGVLIFMPNILLLFLAIAILEDSGYMARAAFIMDLLMHKIGLHGKSFIPMLIGFGCSVPAIMATRTLENRRDRLTTMLVVPLMSCGARLPIYALIIPAFFPEVWHAPMLWIIYFIGILLAIVSAKLLRSTVFRGEPVPFVMELPPYRMPTLKGMLIHTWERGRLFLQKAGTIILGVSVILWAMNTFPKLPQESTQAFENERAQIESGAETDEVKAIMLGELDNRLGEAALQNSLSGRIGQTLEPLIKAMGFDWRIGTAMIGAFAAKEVFVAQMGIVFSLGETDEGSEGLREKLRNEYNPLIGFCIMLFGLISAPCMVTIAVTRRESGSWKWAMLQLGGLTALAFVVTTLVYQSGAWLGIGI